jgi:TonB family protein
MASDGLRPDPQSLMTEGILAKLLSVPAWCLAGLVAASPAVALAQPLVAPGAAVGADARNAPNGQDARGAAEAMERARRLAANPMRLIQEADRVRRRADPEPAETVRPGTTTQASSGVPASRLRAAGSRGVAVLSSDLARPTALREAASLLAARERLSPLQPADVDLPPEAALQADLERPLLRSRINPEVPPRVLREIEPNTEVLADLTIRPDGRVAEVAIVSPTGQALARAIVPALQRWRFEPLPRQRVWRVQLLFRAE